MVKTIDNKIKVSGHSRDFEKNAAIALTKDLQHSLSLGENVRNPGGTGLILSFEGIDASGKKTQSMLLHEWLRSKNFRSEYISFPDYATTTGREIKAFLDKQTEYPIEAVHMLYAVNRLEHKKQIESFLNEGKIVVINRYCDSNIAYGGARGLSLDWLRCLESEMPEADYVFYLKSSPSLSEKRKGKDRDRFEIDASFLERVSFIYDTLSEKPNWFKVEAESSVQSIQYEISKTVEQLLIEGRKETPIRMNGLEPNP